MYQVKVNDKLNFEISRDTEALVINGETIRADIKQIGSLSFHVIHDMASYNVEVVEMDNLAKTAVIKVSGNTYTVTAKDQFDLLLDKLGMSSSDISRISELKAPMPGLVLKIFVNEGDLVTKGDNLFTLEAMKMENIIKAPADVIIKTLKVKAGDKVEKGQMLILF